MNDLVKIVEQSGLEKTQSEMILEYFNEFFNKAKELEQSAKSITITDASQVEEMKKARVTRLQLKQIRIGAEKARKSLKEQSLRQGKAIDGIANIIKAITVPLEQYLENQEKFIEIKEQERKDFIFNERIVKLSPYVIDTNMYNLREMTDDVFSKLLESSKFAKEAQIAAEKKAQEEAIAKAKADAEERERIRIENEKLKAEAMAREKAAEIERAKQAHAKKVADDALRLEREAKEKVQRELEENRREQEKKVHEAKMKAEKERRALEEKERQAKIAPEKDKLFAYAESMKHIPTPEGLSAAGLNIVKTAEVRLLAVSQYVKEELKNL